MWISKAPKGAFAFVREKAHGSGKAAETSRLLPALCQALLFLRIHARLFSESNSKPRKIP